MNRKIVKILPFILIAICTLLSIAKVMPVSAATCGGVDTSLIECEEGGDGSIYHLLSLVIDIFTIGVGILAVVGISWAGIQYLTAGGSEERVTKAKRRLYDIMLGLACYVAIWAIAFWLLPGGIFNPAVDNTGVTKVSIAYSGKSDTDAAFVPQVTFNDGAKDKTYSLVSSNTNIARTFGHNVKCVSAGKVTIGVLTANGTKSSIDVDCEEGTGSSSSGTSNISDQTAADESNGIPKASDKVSATTGSQANTKLKNNKTRIRKETKEIIGKRNEDFYYTGHGKKNYNTAIKKWGSYQKYVKSLGPSFAGYVGKRIPVETAADFQAAAEYVWGLLSIWGPDYDASTAAEGLDHVNWPTSDAFYAGDPSREYRKWGPTNTVGTVLSASGSRSINTKCDTTIGIFLRTTNLSSRSNSRKFTTTIDKLKVGDVINWSHHIAVVGEVYKDKVVLYDGGRRFQWNNKYKYVITRKKSTQMDGTYSSQGNWVVQRPWKINQNVTLKGIN